MNKELEKQVNIASRKRRIAAFIIDHFIVSFLLVLIIFLALGPNFIDENNLDKMTTTMLLVMLPGGLLYFAKDSIKGISVGKWIMGIVVRGSEQLNEVPSFGRLLARNLLIIIWPVEFIVLATSQEKKRLGDKIARTIVVRNPIKFQKTQRILALAGVGIAFFAFMFLFVGTAMKNSEAYKIAIKEIEQSREIIEVTGGIKGYGLMPTGSINISNGYGKAQFEIKILGDKSDLNVSVYLTKDPDGEWELIELKDEK